VLNEDPSSNKTEYMYVLSSLALVKSKALNVIYYCNEPYGVL